MSRERIRRGRVRPFVTDKFPVGRSRDFGRQYISEYDVEYTPEVIDGNPEVGARNRSGERRRTGKRITDC